VATTQAEADQKHFERFGQDHYSYRDMAGYGEEELRADIDEAVSEGNYTKALNLYFLSDAFLGDGDATVKMARLALAFSGMEEAGLIDLS